MPKNQFIAHVIDSMRSWLVGTPLDNSGWLAVVWCVGIIIISVPITTYLDAARQNKYRLGIIIYSNRFNDVNSTLIAATF